VESAADVLDELRITNHNGPAGQAGTFLGTISPAHAQHPLVLAMGFDPVSFDVLQARVDMDAATLQVQLLELEMDNVIIRVPGGLYQVAL